MADRMRVANLFTAVRLILALPAALAFAQPELMSPLLLLAIVITAIATDFADGVVARKTHTASPRGLLFDHTTDFLFVTSGLAGAAFAGLLSAALPLLVVVAFSQYVLDSYWLHRDKQLRMSVLGRWNGILYFVPLGVIAVSRLGIVPGSADLWAMLVGSISYALLISTVLSIIDRAVAPLRAGRDQASGPTE